MSKGGPVFLQRPLEEATQAAVAMAAIEDLTDVEIEETQASARFFADLQTATRPLAAFLSLVQALQWLDSTGKGDKTARDRLLFGMDGDPVAMAAGKATVDDERVATYLERARTLTAAERFFHWQVAFPRLWDDWQAQDNPGGFDAVIGNPPWERVKLQQVEWFAARRPEIAKAQRAAERKRLIQALKDAGDPLAGAFVQAEQQANATARMARSCGDYPLLSGGNVNFYSLFVERAMALVKPQGMVGLLTPSGIASDKTAARFFRRVATEGRLRALYDFENKKVFGVSSFGLMSGQGGWPMTVQRECSKASLGFSSSCRTWTQQSWTIDSQKTNPLVFLRRLCRREPSNGVSLSDSGMPPDGQGGRAIIV